MNCDKFVVLDSTLVTVSAMKATVVHDVMNVRRDTLAIHTVSHVPVVPLAVSMMTSVCSVSAK